VLLESLCEIRSALKTNRIKDIFNEHRYTELHVVYVLLCTVRMYICTVHALSTVLDVDDDEDEKQTGVIRVSS
jgi:hypothetical protein